MFHDIARSLRGLAQSCCVGRSFLAELEQIEQAEHRSDRKRSCSCEVKRKSEARLRLQFAKIRYHRRRSNQIEARCNAKRRHSSCCRATKRITWVLTGADCDWNESDNHFPSDDPFLAKHEKEDDVSDDQSATCQQTQTFHHNSPRHPI